MNLKQLVSEVAKREGKKREVRVGDVREIVGHISDLLIEDPDIVILLAQNGRRRAKRKKK